MSGFGKATVFSNRFNGSNGSPPPSFSKAFKTGYQFGPSNVEQQTIKPDVKPSVEQQNDKPSVEQQTVKPSVEQQNIKPSVEQQNIKPSVEPPNVTQGFGNPSSSAIPNVAQGFGNPSSSAIPNVRKGFGNPSSSAIPNVTQGFGNPSSSAIPNVRKGFGNPSSSAIPNVRKGFGIPSSSAIPNVRKGFGNPSSSAIPNVRKGFGNPSSSAIPNVTQGFGNPSSSAIPNVAQGFDFQEHRKSTIPSGFSQSTTSSTSNLKSSSEEYNNGFGKGTTGVKSSNFGNDTSYTVPVNNFVNDVDITSQRNSRSRLEKHKQINGKNKANKYIFKHYQKFEHTKLNKLNVIETNFMKINFIIEKKIISAYYLKQIQSKYDKLIALYLDLSCKYRKYNVYCKEFKNFNFNFENTCNINEEIIENKYRLKKIKKYCDNKYLMYEVTEDLNDLLNETSILLSELDTFDDLDLEPNPAKKVKK